MRIHHQQLTKRLNVEMSLPAFVSFLETALVQLGFDEETLFDIVFEEGDGHRTELEAHRDQVLALFAPEFWPRLHQVSLSNQWIKGLNLKINWVRRLHGSTLTVSWDQNEPGKTAAITRVLEGCLESLGAVAETATAVSQTEELERLFGAMLLTPQVAEAAREDFLKGDFRACLRAAHRILEKRLSVLIGAPVKKMGDWEELFRREPPCFLLPDLSGLRLQLELTGLVRVLTGMELLLQPLLRGRELLNADPASVLKKLVLISFLVERLETATRNPAAVQGRKRPRVRRAPSAKESRRSVRTGNVRHPVRKKTDAKAVRTRSVKSVERGEKVKIQ